MHAQNWLFLTLECSNRAHSDLDKLSWKLLFSSAAGGLDLKHQGAARRPRRAQDRRRQLRHPHRQEAWEARRHWCRRRGLRSRCSLVELIYFADSPPVGLVRMKPRCTLQAQDVAIEEAQHFEKNVVKSVFGEFCLSLVPSRLSTRHHLWSCRWRQMLWQPEAWKASCRKGSDIARFSPRID